MRDIKFRGWDGKRIIPVSTVEREFMVVENLYGETLYPEGKLNVTLANGNSLTKSKDDDLGLMQYIGLKDKSGVEIYEGDIIQIYQNSGNKKAQVILVEWDGRTCQYRGIYPTISNLCQHEVIGNIYENPELLK